MNSVRVVYVWCYVIVSKVHGCCCGRLIHFASAMIRSSAATAMVCLSSVAVKWFRVLDVPGNLFCLAAALGLFTIYDICASMRLSAKQSCGQMTMKFSSCAAIGRQDWFYFLKWSVSCSSNPGYRLIRNTGPAFWGLLRSCRRHAIPFLHVEKQ